MNTWVLVVMLGIGITDDGGANMYHIESLSHDTCQQMKGWVNSAHVKDEFGGKVVADCFRKN